MKKTVRLKRKKSVMTVGELEDILFELAPKSLADEWDNVGLLVGDRKRSIRRVLAALEISSLVVKEARTRRVQAIVTHHPLILRPLHRVISEAPVGGLVMELVRARIDALAFHTNLDRSSDGTNRALADQIGLRNAEFLQPAPPDDGGVKFSVFVPPGHEKKVIEAIGKAGAGVIGKYSHCTFRSPGTGTYIPLEGAHPMKGAIGRLEQTEELRVECVVSRDGIRRLIEAVRAVHPYEEMAYDVYPLESMESKWGLGLIGELEPPVSLRQLAQQIKRRLGLSNVQLTGDPEGKVRRAAVCSGSGKSVIRSLRSGKADVLITGELDHHSACDAREQGLGVICLGHFESEAIVVPHLAAWLRAHPCVAAAGLEILEAKSETSPFLQV